MPTLTLELPKHHPGQKRVVVEARRYNVLDCGRRFGKTLLGTERIAKPMLDGYPTAWFAPNYKYLTDAWRDIRRIYRPVTKHVSQQEHRLELLTGGVLECWTLDDPDAGRSRKYKRVIVDEAAKCRHLEQAWQESIRPTLTDYQGDAFFLSTPKGQNYFYRLYLLGLDPEQTDWSCWQMPTSTNPFISKDEIRAAQRELPERVFQQEYEAIFLEDSAGVFRGVRAVVDTGRKANEPARPDRHYFMGVDIARVEDFTVLSVLDNTGRQVHLERFNQVSWERLVERVVRVSAKYSGQLTVLIESNNQGDPVTEMCKKAFYQNQVSATVDSFHTTALSKGPLIDCLAIAIEHGELSLLDDDVQTGELQAYEYDVTPSGNVRMQAPAGMHDDTVMALAFAQWARKEFSSGVRPAIILPSDIDTGSGDADNDDMWDEYESQ